MYASQLIYTACGKDKTGAFSVWSKSSDITKAESDEIAKLMFYKRPADLPYEPTEEELRTLFPRKYGYFRLASGRLCLARSVYIGKVYSDLDQRSGNYIIHAFVFDDIGNLHPMRFFGSDIFRSALSYQEWHEQDAPESLPAIEINDPPVETILSETAEFLRGERLQQFASLLQGAIHACASDQKVTFYDTDDNLAHWYHAISLCVPAGMQKDLSYCSFYTPTPAVSTPTTTVTDVKMRNVSPTVLSSLYSYQQEVRSGRYAFDFSGGVMNSDVPLSRYVRSVVKQLPTSPAKALKMADTIDKLMTVHGCTLDEATNLCSLLEQDLEWISDLRELLSVIEHAKRITPTALPTIADGLYHLCVANSGWPYDQALLEVYRFVFDYSENANKGFIINQYLRHLADFGIDSAAPCDAYVRQVKDKAPFLWVNFVDFIFDTDTTFFRDYITENSHSFNSRYLVYTSMIDAIQELDEAQKNTVHRYCRNMIIRAIKAESIPEFNALLPHLRKLGPNADTRFIGNALQTLIPAGGKVTDICSIDFLINLAQTVSSAELGYTVLAWLISENQDDSILAAKYSAALKAPAASFAAYDKRLRESGNYRRFFENLEILAFAQCPNPSPNELNRYYSNILLNERDTGLFMRKLSQRLTSARDSALIAECLSAYRTYFAPLPDSHSQLIPCLEALSGLITRSGMEPMIDYAKKRGVAAFDPLTARLHQLGRFVPHEYAVLDAGVNTQQAAQRSSRGQGPSQQQCLTALVNGSFFAPLASQQAVTLYLTHYTADLVRMYLAFAKRDFVAVFEGCFVPFIYARNFAPALIDAMEDLGKEDHAIFVTDLFSYAFSYATEAAEVFRSMVGTYLDGLSGGRRKKVLAAVKGRILPEYRGSVMPYIDQYESDHASPLAKLLRKKAPPSHQTEWGDTPPAKPRKSRKDQD